MSRYANNPQAIRNLIRPTEVHRDVYIDQEVFELEMKHLFANTWVFVGHESQTSLQLGERPYFNDALCVLFIIVVRAKGRC